MALKSPKLNSRSISRAKIWLRPTKYASPQFYPSNFWFFDFLPRYGLVNRWKSQNRLFFCRNEAISRQKIKKSKIWRIELWRSIFCMSQPKFGPRNWSGVEFLRFWAIFQKQTSKNFQGPARDCNELAINE